MEAVLESFVTGLPVLLLHYLVTLTMLAIGVTIYIWMTPYKELELIRGGNAAAASHSARLSVWPCRWHSRWRSASAFGISLYGAW